MSDSQQTPSGQPPQKPPSSTFLAPKEEKENTPVTAWVIAGLVVIIIVGILIFVTHKPSSGPANTLQPLADYSSSLAISQLAMSEAENLSGGKYTYIDGHIKNNGAQTVTSVTVQVVFKNDMEMPPQIETVPVSLIRTHDPYIDTQPIGAAPLKPGDDREFRLTFEIVPMNWNQEMPQVRVTGVETK
jgi:Protein of unknown function (DUF2393)